MSNSGALNRGKKGVLWGGGPDLSSFICMRESLILSPFGSHTHTHTRAATDARKRVPAHAHTHTHTHT